MQNLPKALEMDVGFHIFLLEDFRYILYLLGEYPLLRKDSQKLPPGSYVSTGYANI